MDFAGNALIAAGAFLGVVAGLLASGRIDRRRRRDEAMANALTYFQGGSQKRSVGIASLVVLNDQARGWPSETASAVNQLLYAQLLYLLPHGNNRWESHEIANIEKMLELLIEEGSPVWLTRSSNRRARLDDAITEYIADSDTFEHWDRSEDREDGGRPDLRAIHHLRIRLETWQKRQLMTQGSFS